MRRNSNILLASGKNIGSQTNTFSEEKLRPQTSNRAFTKNPTNRAIWYEMAWDSSVWDSKVPDHSVIG